MSPRGLRNELGWSNLVVLVRCSSCCTEPKQPSWINRARCAGLAGTLLEETCNKQAVWHDDFFNNFFFFIILDFFYKIGLNRLYKGLNWSKLYKKNPSTTYLDEGLISQNRFFDIKKYFAYKPYFNHITRYFRCNFQNQREKPCRVMGSNLI